MFSVHLLSILYGVLLVGGSLDKFENNPCAERCPPRCLSGWRAWHDSCYRFTTNKPWNDDKTSCQEMGGEIAAPRSLNETEFIVSFGIQDDTVGDFVWIGCNDQVTEGKWDCNYGKSGPVGFENWRSGEPNDVSNEDCVGLVISSEGRWMDYTCDHSSPAICRRAQEPARMHCFTVGASGRLDESCFQK